MKDGWVALMSSQNYLFELSRTRTVVQILSALQD